MNRIRRATIQTELGTEIQCAQCKEFWPADGDFFFLKRNAPFLVQGVLPGPSDNRRKEAAVGRKQRGTGRSKRSRLRCAPGSRSNPMSESVRWALALTYLGSLFSMAAFLIYKRVPGWGWFLAVVCVVVSSTTIHIDAERGRNDDHQQGSPMTNQNSAAQAAMQEPSRMLTCCASASNSTLARIWTWRRQFAPRCCPSCAAL